METEQELSQFKKNRTVELAPAFSVQEKNNKLSAGSLLQRTMAGIYTLADCFSGSPSYFLRNFSNDFSGLENLQNVANELINHKFVDDIRFADTRYNDAPPFYHVDILSNYPSKITDGFVEQKYMAHGFGQNAEEVFSKALGEFLERYFLTCYRRNRLIRGSFRDLRNKKISIFDPGDLAGFSDEQKKARPKLSFNDKSEFWWEKTRHISSGATVYLPAQLIYWNYRCEEHEPFIREVNTNGAGGMFTKEGAILGGIYELIQRDAFLLHWLNGLPPCLINPHTVPGKKFQELLAQSERYGFKIYCLDLKIDTGVPVFAVILSDPSGKGPRYVMGMGCESDPVKASFRALEEAWSIYYWIRPLSFYPAISGDYDLSYNKIGQAERARLWANPEMAHRLKFFISWPEKAFGELRYDYPESFSSPQKELDFLVERVEKLGPGYEVYYYEAKHPMLSKFEFYSVKVIIPKLVPLHLNEPNAALGSERIREFPKKLGVRAKLNPLPHLFP